MMIIKAVMDANIYDVYFDQIQAYFDKYNIDLKVHKTMIGEKAKSMCVSRGPAMGAVKLI